MTPISAIDWTVILVYLAAMVAFGHADPYLHQRPGQRARHD